MDIAYENNLFRACSVLFGSDVPVNHDFLSYIQTSGVKSAFRQRALVTHPDRVVFLDETAQRQSTEQFIETTWAYKQLLDFITNRENGSFSLKNRPAANSEPSGKEYHETNRYVRYYNGPMPKRILLFGEYLYYKRTVPWKAFIQSIVWQRQLRPRFGDVACRWRYLTEEDVRFLITSKKLCEKIGETAVRFDILRQAQVNAVVLHQRLNQRKIGEYFVESGYLTREKINSMLTEFKIHNSGFNIRKIY